MPQPEDAVKDVMCKARSRSPIGARSSSTNIREICGIMEQTDPKESIRPENPLYSHRDVATERNRLMPTEEQKTELQKLGYTDQEIRVMASEQARQIIEARRPPDRLPPMHPDDLVNTPELPPKK
jgi:hypothetical protein